MTNMPNPYHQDEAQKTVSQCAKIKLERELGLETLSARADPKVIEIILNAGGKPWQKRTGEKMQPIGALSASHSNSTNKAIAGYHGQEITKGRPLLEREPPLDGLRKIHSLSNALRLSPEAMELRVFM